MPDVTIQPDDPYRDDVLALLDEHLADMYAESPPESVHALDPSTLARPGLTFWTARAADGSLLGCVALKELDATGGELKSMRTAGAARGRGVGGAMLAHVIGEATARSYRTLHLETGTQDYFAPARRLYARGGFVECAPFADYALDPYSVFFVLDLDPVAAPARPPTPQAAGPRVSSRSLARGRPAASRST